MYLSFGDDAAEESDGETERLGLVLVTFQDGKVDLYLDVEKVEARWETKQVSVRVGFVSSIIHYVACSKSLVDFPCWRHTRASISASFAR